ncbi:hypothetical protein [Paraburkholderia sp. BCC1876]|uniref:hypothetical protein n=1 Tax=Paraburkholderia sp. BCC1876 TaxID=2676303 RepID=UPI0015926EDF|nr:hypothetical protein [Paraburkholderia sp. BCC1876]
MTNQRIRTEFWGSAALVCTFFAVAFSSILTVTASSAPLSAAGLAALTAFSVEFARRRKLQSLRLRFANASGSAAWTISVNAVPVGSITERDYVALRIEALLDPRNYVGQFLELGRFLMRCLLVTVVGMPILAFWSFVLGSIIAPDSVIASLSGWRAMFSDPTPLLSGTPMLALAAKKILVEAGSFTMVAGGGMLFLAKRFPITNVFRHQVEGRLRRSTGTAARGDVQVVCATAGTHDAGTAMNPAV